MFNFDADYSLPSIGALEKLFSAGSGLDLGINRLARSEAERIKLRVPRATGNLARSIQPKRNAPFDYEVNVGSSYAYWADQGRRAGRMPPIDAIRYWLLVKGFGGKGVDINRKAWAIAKAIAKKGTKGAHFMPNQTDINELERDLEQLTVAEINKALAL